MQATKLSRADITEDMIKAAEAVFITMAAVETIKPIVTAYQLKILNEEKYPYAERWHNKRDITPTDWINDDKSTYLMSDKDFKHYMQRCREEQAKAGLITESPEHCPLLVAEDNQRKAENVLMDSMKPITTIGAQDVCGSLEHRREYIEITLKLLAPIVKRRIK